ncbi:flocculation-associated PEP-CTERM protein PepA [Pseudocolwellia agarivorans]|uniref:flocculation-associated PEP-CTERM protein PepA n=1 Tax=Pseudocolwellia agarivorans TaxID=1911682 RepID=UPI0009851B17|nr:flocculation-associated PEP-CTERM protein PepA [Pseudocolwellia agarivorans]
MNKLLLASLITGTSFTASADVITFNDSSFNGTPGSEVIFDFIDYDPDIATVTQIDTDLSGDIAGNDAFSEFGATDVVNFKLGATNISVDPAYEVFFDYAFNGMAATVVDDEIVVTFSSVGASTGLYVDTTVNGTFDGGMQIASFGLNAGGCTIDISPGPLQNKGLCALDLSLTFMAGYFFNSAGDDLSTTPGSKSAELIVTVQDIVGLLPFYPGGAGSSQTFEIQHDGNMTMTVPEPATVAILGLSLLGFAGMSRRKL